MAPVPQGGETKAMFDIDTKMEVLVVSASRHEQFQVKMLLKQVGLNNVTTLDSGIDALNLCTKKRFKVVICDQEVSFIPGWLFVKELKTSDKVHNCAVILMGKEPCVVPKAELKQYGVLSYLQLPYSITELMSALVKSLNEFEDHASVENRYTEAKVALIAKNGAHATDLYHALKEETKSSSRSSLGLAQSHELTGNFKEAAKLVDAVVKNGDVGASALMMALRLALTGKNDVQAKSLVKSLLAASAGSVLYYQAAGDECLKHGFLDLATDIFNQALGRGHRRPLISLGIAKALFLRGSMKESLSQAKHAVSVHGDFLEALNLEGVCLRRLGRHEDALRCYEKALKLSPLDAKVYFNMALCAVAMESLSEADGYLKTCLGIEPGYLKAKEKQAEVRKMIAGEAIGSQFNNVGAA